jgi:acyl dehydratase
MTLYYEDIEKGTELPELAKEPVDQVQIVRYAGASGDFNPIHTVPEMAKMVGLDGAIAHGMLIMAFAGQLITDWAGAGKVRRLKVRFSGMTRPGEKVICRGEITGKDDSGEEPLVMGKLTVKGEDDSLKLKGEFTVAVQRKA